MFIKIKVRGGGGYSLWEDFTGLNSRKDVKLKTRLVKHTFYFQERLCSEIADTPGKLAKLITIHVKCEPFTV